MKKAMWPKAGTKLSIEWRDVGPMIEGGGSRGDIIGSLAILTGQLEAGGNFPHEAIEVAAENGKELFEALMRGSCIVDLNALKTAKEKGELE